MLQGCRKVKQCQPYCVEKTKAVNYGRRKYRRPYEKKNMNPDDTKLSSLLRRSRVSPSLPPRFQENVWRRIEDTGAPEKPATWLDALAALLLRPKFALVAATVLVMAGALFGVREGSLLARQDAQAQYMTAVAPANMH